MATSTINTVVESEIIATNATLYRIGAMRILRLINFAAANSTLKIDSKDAPSIAVVAPAYIAGATNALRLGQVTINPDPPYYVQRYYVGTYNSSQLGVSGVAATDKTSAVLVWSV